MFGRNAASPETVALQLPNQPIDENDYAKYLVQRITEVHKLFCSIKKICGDDKEITMICLLIQESLTLDKKS